MRIMGKMIFFIHNKYSSYVEKNILYAEKIFVTYEKNHLTHNTQRKYLLHMKKII